MVSSQRFFTKYKNERRSGKKSPQNNMTENKLKDYDENFFSEFTIPTYEEWVKSAEKALKGAPFEKMMVTKTYEDIDLQPIYRVEDTVNLEVAKSMPGAAPYLRGTNELGYINKPWKISQECSQIASEELNEVLKDQLEKGCTEMNIVLNQITKAGKDINLELLNEIAGEGLVLSTLEDMNTAFREINIEKYPLHIYAGQTAFYMNAMLLALLKSQGKDPSVIKGCLGADPLSELAKTGQLTNDLEELMEQMKKTIVWASENAPQLRTILIQGHPYHDAGASAIQELAYSIATAIFYIKDMLEKGLEINQIARQIKFSFSIGTNFFMEISKMRAARIVWSQVIEAFGGDEESQKMLIHARTSAYTKTVYDPYVNMLRTTTESFSGVVGGIDGLHVSYFDEPIKPADEFSTRISRNTQIVLQEECNLTQPIDPAGGSWYIESLTAIVAEKAWSLIQEIEKEGGMLEVLQKEIPQKVCAEIAGKRFANLSKRKDVKVGINMYPNMSEERIIPPEKDYESLVKGLIEQTEEYKLDIDKEEKEEKIRKAQAHSNCFGCTSSAFLAGASLEELTQADKDSVALKVRPLDIHRASEKFEDLRMATETYKALTGNNVKVFLANMGPIPQHKGRADFSTGFFEVGAFEVLKNDGFETVEAAAQAAYDSEAEVAVICSTDATYPELVPPLAKLIKEKRPNIRLFLAGRPAADMKETYDKAGIDDYVHVSANVYEIITTIQKERGII